VIPELIIPHLLVVYARQLLLAKSVHNSVLDGAFQVLDAADLMTACNAEPTTRTEAITTFKLADVAMTPVTDFTISDGDTNGRKVRMAAKSSVPVDTSGTATHIALVDATNLLYVTTCTSQALTSGNTVNFPAWDVEIADPT
jgi:hypothetical protein